MLGGFNQLTAFDFGLRLRRLLQLQELVSPLWVGVCDLLAFDYVNKYLEAIQVSKLLVNWR